MRLAALLMTAALLLCAQKALAFSAKDYTRDPELAQKLTSVFEGKARLFSNTKKGYALDSYMGGGTFYIDGRVGGSQCYIYANAVYYYLFGEIPYHGEGPYEGARVCLKGRTEVNCRLFRELGIGMGTYIRTTNKSDGSYNGSTGHSLIVLGYDEEHIDWLDANWGSKRYYVHAHSESWEYFNEKMFDGRCISHAVVPYRTSTRILLVSGLGETYDLITLGIGNIIVLPDSVRSVEENAFVGVGAEAIVVPKGVTYLGKKALADTIIFGYPGSAAEEYAREASLAFYPIGDGWLLIR